MVKFYSSKPLFTKSYVCIDIDKDGFIDQSEIDIMAKVEIHIDRLEWIAKYISFASMLCEC